MNNGKETQKNHPDESQLPKEPPMGQPDSFLGEYELRYLNYNEPKLAKLRLSPGCPGVIKKTERGELVWRNRGGSANVSVSENGELLFGEYVDISCDSYGKDTVGHDRTALKGNVVLLLKDRERHVFHGKNTLGYYPKSYDRYKTAIMQRKYKREPVVRKYDFDMELKRTGALQDKIRIDRDNLPGRYNISLAPAINHGTPSAVPPECRSDIVRTKKKDIYNISSAPGEKCFNGRASVAGKTKLRLDIKYHYKFKDSMILLESRRLYVDQFSKIGLYRGEAGFLFHYRKDEDRFFFYIQMTKAPGNAD
ncbi:MAG: hypothetical protein GY854_26235 [Deltaproteobacteria bacterium]|nr:hypothetical protein [Deltaproteobacteria bacterium]